MTVDETELNQAEDPGELFIQCWRIASQWDSATIALARQAQRVLLPELRNALQTNHEPKAAVSRVLTIALGKQDRPQGEFNARLLVLMHAIDQVFESCHPRTVLAHPAGGSRPTVPNWLWTLDTKRAKSGAYAVRDDLRLIARGPLTRAYLGETALGGERLDVQFHALNIATSSIRLQSRHIQVRHLVVAPDGFLGVKSTTSSRDGHERVGFIPVAVAKDDISISRKVVEGTDFAEITAHGSDTVGERFCAELDKMGVVDIALAPEFAVTDEGFKALAAKLHGTRGALCRLALAGSGASPEVDDVGFVWNEARLLNGRGKLLWKQRKLWSAFLGPERAKSLGLVDDCFKDRVNEMTACGREIVVGDVETFGRIVILICQDLTEPGFTTELLQQYQPDWVLTPILDEKIEPGRWAHANALERSKHSNARFLVVNSLAIAAKLSSDGHFGMAVGPYEQAADEAAGRRVAFLPATPDRSSVHSASVTWRDGDPAWAESRIEKHNL